MSYDCDHEPKCVNQRHHVSRFYTERNGWDVAAFLNTPEELRAAGIIDQDRADKLIAELEADRIRSAVSEPSDAVKQEIEKVLKDGAPK